MTESLLNGWREIAEFIGYSEETARKLAKKDGLPIFRSSCGVIASRKVIECWVIENSIKKAQKKKQ